jgi:bifunctional UDP-N-acetylglucosamine pyrophosphorylase/glucosamine-1-phosphate N-acetyltransferase
MLLDSKENKMAKKLGCIILAAGKGTRMKSALPKPLHNVAGRSMVAHVIAAAEALNPDKIVVVIGSDMPEMAAAVQPHTTVIQATPNGTGGAALTAREHFKDFDGDILVLFSDVPLVTVETLQKMLGALHATPDAGVCYAGIEVTAPNTYGRMVLNADGTLQKIVEFKDASDAQKKITLCWGGMVCADGSKIFEWLAQVDNHNAQNEYYLTDLPVIARKDNRSTQVITAAAEEMEGANSRVDLAYLEKLAQQRLRTKHMLGGATLIDPATVYFSYDTVIGQDVTIEPNVFFGLGVTIADNVTIHAHSYIEGATIENGAHIGPFARLRAGTKIGKNAKVGNFVEIKNTHLGNGAKANHLSYLGDAEIGEKANIGAGTITCNYDGFSKYKTVIGKGAFIGSNSALVAPVMIGDGAIVGAGSTITKDVPENCLSIERARQLNIENGAEVFRRKKLQEKGSK